MLNNIDACIFDMDGTIADTSHGIFESYRHVARLYGKKIPCDEELKDIIGGSLLINLRNKLNLHSNEIEQALVDYRDYYKKSGYTDSTLYPGIRDALRILHKKGYCLSIATMKAEVFAKQMIGAWGLESYFTSIHGMDENDRITKVEMIMMCMDENNCSPRDTVLIGDTIQDKKAADTSNIDFIAATYGFGFHKEECINNNISFIESPIELVDVIE